jgi:hypothetical protein
MQHSSSFGAAAHHTESLRLGNSMLRQLPRAVSIRESLQEVPEDQQVRAALRGGVGCRVLRGRLQVLPVFQKAGTAST